ncbi:HAD family hydrolase [Mycolicibacterium brisbanense]|uniref:HAD-superfamily hydrolase n=1 Tax=Mycolicibacterium brisbanense TaxID=146020 RepID=A0A100VUN4_9MYCO|nr:HAD family phosphatase [Mycolicibacterium brisbanense]MCV7156227.1 HAD family phosphatase [Mycolicibacterium brisbanense]GAS86382.1 HAD-superfamily hydrolase [Mycolicibacterium brisbanense]
MWDMDGTLVDTEPHWMNAQRRLAATHGIVWTDEDNLKVVGQSMEFVAKTLQQSGVEQPTLEIIRSLVEDVAATIQTKIPWLPCAELLLSDLARSGVPCALVTMAHTPIPHLVAAAAIPGAFAAVIAGDDVARGKPDPEPYLTAARRLKVEPTHCVAVEDSLSGTLSAESAGMAVVVVPGVVSVPPSPGRHFVRSLADLSVEKLREIVDVSRPADNSR